MPKASATAETVQVACTVADMAMVVVAVEPCAEAGCRPLSNVAMQASRETVRIRFKTGRPVSGPIGDGPGR